MKLTKKDNIDFTRAEKTILECMSDGKWHSASELIRITGQREALRRMRELRKKRSVKEIEKRRDGDSRDWSYRLHFAT